MLHWGSETNWASGTELGWGAPLGMKEAQGSTSAQQRPQDKALAWPICFVTFSTHILARQTRQTHSAPAFRARWPCSTRVQADSESQTWRWRLEAEPADTLRLPAVGKACQVQGPARPRAPEEVGSRGSDRALSLLLSGAGLLGPGTWIPQVYTDPRADTPDPKCPRPLLRHPAPASGLVAVPGA